MSRRNEKGQFAKTNVDRDIADNQTKNMLQYIWFILKVVVVAIVIMPFLDKFRRNETVGKVMDALNSTDFGCKSQKCVCQPCMIQSNKTKTDEPLSSFGGSY